MDCSRCGGELETYALGDKEAYVCDDCGFVDTPVEHEATKRPEPEPWAKALERFHEKFVEGDVAVVGSGETAALVEIDAQAASDDDPDEASIDADESGAEPDETESDTDETDADPEEVEPDETDSDAETDDESDESSDDVDGGTTSDTAEEREKPA
jgi:hypothetical protein